MRVILSLRDPADSGRATLLQSSAEHVWARTGGRVWSDARSEGPVRVDDERGWIAGA